MAESSLTTPFCSRAGNRAFPLRHRATEAARSNSERARSSPRLSESKYVPGQLARERREALDSALVEKRRCVCFVKSGGECSGAVGLSRPRTNIACRSIFSFQTRCMRPKSISPSSPGRIWYVEKLTFPKLRGCWAVKVGFRGVRGLGAILNCWIRKTVLAGPVPSNKLAGGVTRRGRGMDGGGAEE
eukprot:scaffold2141_cov282-Pinguiococcus_pyrenoidosus.AAC.32